MSKLWRCLNPNCSEAEGGAAPVYDFAADAPVCPKCGTSQKDSPRTIAERARIHYLVNDDKGVIRTPNGRRSVACEPARVKLPKHATGERGAVTCPECLASAVLASHVAGSVDQGQQITANVPPQLAAGKVGGE